MRRIIVLVAVIALFVSPVAYGQASKQDLKGKATESYINQLISQRTQYERLVIQLRFELQEAKQANDVLHKQIDELKEKVEAKEAAKPEGTGK